MRSEDFLHGDAKTELCEHFIAAGARCSLSTNCEDLLRAARESFLPMDAPLAPVEFTLRFWVDGSKSPGPRPKPYARGLGHLAFLGFDARSSILVNLRTRHAIGRFSATIASDTSFWRMTVFPMLLSVLAGSLGVVELHASCVAKDEVGLILMGPSRSGKSTLAMALTEMGFNLLSDDRTFCSVTDERLWAWGLPRALKLRQDSGAWFSPFRDRLPDAVQNGEPVFHFEPSQRLKRCEPRVLVVLERRQVNSFVIEPITSPSVRSRIENDLLAESKAAVRRQDESVAKILALPCRSLRYGGSPHHVAQQLAESILDHFGCRALAEAR